MADPIENDFDGQVTYEAKLFFSTRLTLFSNTDLFNADDIITIEKRFLPYFDKLYCEMEGVLENMGKETINKLDPCPFELIDGKYILTYRPTPEEEAYRHLDFHCYGSFKKPSDVDLSLVPLGTLQENWSAGYGDILAPSLYRVLNTYSHVTSSIMGSYTFTHMIYPPPDFNVTQVIDVRNR